MLPNVSQALREWEAGVTIKTLTRTTMNFNDVRIVSTRIIPAVLQDAPTDRINPAQLDWSKRYIMLHTRSTIALREYLVLDGQDYEIVQLKHYPEYGYYEAICEATGKTPIASTPVPEPEPEPEP